MPRPLVPAACELSDLPACYFAVVAAMTAAQLSVLQATAVGFPFPFDVVSREVVRRGFQAGPLAAQPAAVRRAAAILFVADG